jgi:hypothetical protein
VREAGLQGVAWEGPFLSETLTLRSVTGRPRPRAGLKDWPCERAGSARKRTLAEGRGLRYERSLLGRQLDQCRPISVSGSNGGSARAFCANLPPARGRNERDPEARGDFGVRRRWLQPARRHPRGGALARLRALRSDLIDSFISACYGRIFKRTGDGSIVEFRSVVDAVRFEVRTACSSATPACRPSAASNFASAFTSATSVEESDGDLMCDGVNIAARMEGIAKPGGICLSEDRHADAIASARRGSASTRTAPRPLQISV